MARGLSPNQLAVLAYLEEKTGRTPDEQAQQERFAEWGYAPTPFKPGCCSQAELRKVLLERLSVDMADGNMSRLCHALRNRGLLMVDAYGTVQLPKFIPSPLWNFEWTPLESDRCLSRREVWDAMHVGTAKALQESAPLTGLEVASTTFWAAVRTAVRTAHDAKAATPSRTLESTSTLYARDMLRLIEKWQGEGWVRRGMVRNPKNARWGGWYKYRVTGFTFQSAEVPSLE